MLIYENPGIKEKLPETVLSDEHELLSRIHEIIKHGDDWTAEVPNE